MNKKFSKCIFLANAIALGGHWASALNHHNIGIAIVAGLAMLVSVYMYVGEAGDEL